MKDNQAPNGEFYGTTSTIEDAKMYCDLNRHTVSHTLNDPPCACIQAIGDEVMPIYSLFSLGEGKTKDMTDNPYHFRLYCKNGEQTQPPEVCSPMPNPKKCSADTADTAQTSMSCKIPKCIIDEVKRWEWPGIGFGR